MNNTAVIMPKKIFLLLALFSHTLNANAASTVVKRTYHDGSELITYSDRNSQTYQATNTVTTWGANHITKTTLYTFADKTTNKVTIQQKPVVAAPTYDANKEIIVTTYGDGYSTTKTSLTKNSKISWGADHITKTTAYMFPDKTSNKVISTQQGVGSTPVYNADSETIQITYGDGYKAIQTNTATNSGVTWGSDHITKTTTYTFLDKSANQVAETIQPTLAGASFSAANYPSNWTTVGSVTKPSVTALVNNYADGYSQPIESGTVDSPFNQSTLSAKGVTDPNAVVKTDSGVKYNLAWGEPDKAGPGYVALYSSGTWVMPSPITVMGHTFSGQCLYGAVYGYCSNGATISAPHPDVIDAWNQGWTGNGVNILMVDDYAATVGKGVVGGDQHGITTMTLANRYAAGATMYGLDYDLDSNGLPVGTIRAKDGSIPTNTNPVINIGVINASFTNTFQTDANSWAKVLAGGVALSGFNLTNAVITKAAGNDGNATPASSDTLSSALVNNPATYPRLLLVGALTQTGSVTSPVSLASYSNTAGSDLKFQNRFLVTSGTVPFLTGYVAVDGQPVAANGNLGTSYAAPRVAGMVAIVEQKFPNLTGANTADIFLQTARYDTLSCYTQAGGCNKEIYGQGEASLSRALAPVGKLR